MFEGNAVARGFDQDYMVHDMQDKKPRTFKNDPALANFKKLDEKDGSSTHYWCLCLLCDKEYNDKIANAEQMNLAGLSCTVGAFDPPAKIRHTARDCHNHLKKCQAYIRMGGKLPAGSWASMPIVPTSLFKEFPKIIRLKPGAAKTTGQQSNKTYGIRPMNASETEMMHQKQR